jgi:short-subunit dehydrogenase
VGLDAEQQTRMLQLNVVTLTDLTRALLPGMLARKQGRIMLLASTAAFQPGPGMAVYCATKAYVLSFGEAIAFETRGTGVTVTTVCPGATKTNFQAVADIDDSALLLKSGVMTSAQVARQGYRAMKNGTAVTVTGIPNLVGAIMGRHLPHAVVVPLAGKLLAK